MSGQVSAATIDDRAAVAMRLCMVRKGHVLNLMLSMCISYLSISISLPTISLLSIVASLTSCIARALP